MVADEGSDQGRREAMMAKASDIVSSYDNLIASLLSALVAGTILLVINGKLSPAVAGTFTLAGLLLAAALCCTLFHMSLHAKLLLLVGNDSETAPSEQMAVLIDSFIRIRRYSQISYSLQFGYFLLGVVTGTLGIVIHVLTSFTHPAGVVICAIGLVAFSGCSAFLMLIAFKSAPRSGRTGAMPSPVAGQSGHAAAGHAPERRRP